MSFKPQMIDMDEGGLKMLKLMGTLLKPILSLDREIMSGDKEYVGSVILIANQTATERMADIIDILALNQSMVLQIIGGGQQ